MRVHLRTCKQTNECSRHTRAVMHCQQHAITLPGDTPQQLHAIARPPPLPPGGGVSESARPPAASSSSRAASSEGVCRMASSSSSNATPTATFCLAELSTYRQPCAAANDAPSCQLTWRASPWAAHAVRGRAGGGRSRRPGQCATQADMHDASGRLSAATQRTQRVHCCGHARRAHAQASGSHLVDLVGDHHARHVWVRRVAAGLGHPRVGQAGQRVAPRDVKDCGRRARWAVAAGGMRAHKPCMLTPHAHSCHSQASLALQLAHRT